MLRDLDGETNRLEIREMGQLTVGGRASAFRGEHLEQAGECFIGANINNRSKLLYDTNMTNG
jgi:hypothetical protein